MNVPCWWSSHPLSVYFRAGHRFQTILTTLATTFLPRDPLASSNGGISGLLVQFKPCSQHARELLWLLWMCSASPPFSARQERPETWLKEQFFGPLHDQFKLGKRLGKGGPATKRLFCRFRAAPCPLHHDVSGRCRVAERPMQVRRLSTSAHE